MPRKARRKAKQQESSRFWLQGYGIGAGEPTTPTGGGGFRQKGQRSDGAYFQAISETSEWAEEMLNSFLEADCTCGPDVGLANCPIRHGERGSWSYRATSERPLL